VLASFIIGCAALISFARAGEQGELSERQRVLHALNRLGYGPRPGDVERVEKLGVDQYIRLQLRPESIDDSAVDRAVARLDTLNMSSGHLMDEFFGDIRRFLQQQARAGNSQEMKLRYGIEPSKTAMAANPSPDPGPPSMQDLARRDAIRCVGELQQAKILRAVLSERQLNEVLVDFWSNHFNIDVRKDSCRVLKVADDRDAIRPHVLGRFRDLLGASAHSPAMLTYLDNTENSATRQRSGLEKKVIEIFIQSKLGMKASGLVSDNEGLNENYGREILELHTLGVDGGYTQQDVQEVARCFTGWGTNPFTGNFGFDANRHDKGQKIVLDHVIAPGGGVEDGERVLDILAIHPSTAKHIAYELCQRFVADDPPSELVDRAAKIFLLSDGDLRMVVRSIVTSPEFFSPRAYRAKIKSPFEYAASAVRAAGAQFSDAPPLAAKVRATAEGAAALGYGAPKLSADRRKSLNWWVHDMGEPLFAFSAPTGYPEISAKWVSPGALIDRLNFAMALTSQNVSDLRPDPARFLRGADADQPATVVDRLADALLHGEMTASTRKTLMNQLPHGDAAATVDARKLAALLLGSPEFQRK